MVLKNLGIIVGWICAYIVYLGSYPNRFDNTATDHDRAVRYHQAILGSCLGSTKKAKSSIFYSYNRFINGFAANLAEDEVPKVRSHPKVLSVFLSKGRKVQTTNSWDFLGLEKGLKISLFSPWKEAKFGEEVIIGNLDHGVWPESKSFSDEGMPPVPARWRGICQTNKRDGIQCNSKLIGVRYYNRNYLQMARRIARRHNTTYHPTVRVITARDYNGHGTHTLSTAGGNFVPNVSFFGQGHGVAKGGAPRARIASYKVCWDAIGDVGECFDADIMAGIEAAISDGVDILSISLGGLPNEYIHESLSIGCFHAVKNGILVVAAGGNSGPIPSTVSNVAPWIFTVAASTTNRQFVNYITLGNKQVIKGFSLSEKGLEPEKFYPVITGTDAKLPNATIEEASICNPETLDHSKVRGKIMVCRREEPVSLQYGKFAAAVGAAGVIIANTKSMGFDTSSDPHIITASLVNSVDADSIYAYMKSTMSPVAHISEVKTEFDENSTISMASFSSRGPNLIESAILKPDITAPGVNIIAAYSGAKTATTLQDDNRLVPYLPLSGTSMACPHVSGIAALVKTLHSDWSPAAIRSAIMTTATPSDRNGRPILDYNRTEATPFAYGAGHVNPTNALDPGLVYDLNPENYLDYLCAHGYNDSLLRSFTISDKPYSCPLFFRMEDFNYPSIFIPKLNGPVKYTRYLKNVGTPGTYNVSVKAPAGVSISVQPATLQFDNYGDEKKFEVMFNVVGNITSDGKDYAFGELTWSDGTHSVRSPIVMKLKMEEKKLFSISF
ncbi:subtilisin-like protease SBT5.4 [Mangifera indica]|uniref:subtilisin-like protease SBT5.4 n=1 Tax=Mangifera indica TaxID=29780 RepID=UPI001CFBBE44|nr:subtilisin-like protease SBT5.4 [Mangifera indica]